MKISGIKIKNLRKSKGLSRAELSRISGISIRTLEDWESGRRQPRNFDIIFQLCSTLSIQPSDILSDDSIPELHNMAMINSDLIQDNEESELELVEYIENIYEEQGLNGILRLLDRFIYNVGIEKSLKIVEGFKHESGQDG